MGSRFIAAGRGQCCPVCGQDKHCRWSDPDFVHCQDIVGDSQAPIGWLYRGQSKIGFGLWARDKGKPYVKPQKPVKKKEKPVYSGLSIQEKADLYGLIVENMSLYDYHEEWLTSRGLSTEAIKRFNYRSTSSLRLLEPIDKRLPGINQSDPRKLSILSGLLLPMADIEGRILGFQAVPEGRIVADLNKQAWSGGAKYFWLSSTSQNGYGPSLEDPYNTTPLGFFNPIICNSPKILYLSEGALKSAIISSVMGWNVLGTASGGRFCRLQLHESFLIGGFEKVILIPDAGMITNNGIAKAYSQLSRDCESLCIPLELLWYGQKTKESGDFDDLILNNGSNIAYELLPFDEYHLKQPQNIRDSSDKHKEMRRLYLIRKEKPVIKPEKPNVDRIREELKNQYETIFYAKTKPAGLHVFQHPTGLGKTTTLATVIKEGLASSRLKGRVLILVKTKQDAKMVEAMLGRNCFVMLGRSDEPRSEFYCFKANTINSLAMDRHNSGVACQSCYDLLLAFRRQYQTIEGLCPYRNQKSQSEKAQIVLSTYKSFLNDGSKLDSFDYIVIDEDIFGAGLTENIELSKVYPDRIRELINKDAILSKIYGEESAIWKILNLLDDIITESTNQKENDFDLNSLLDALDAKRVARIALSEEAFKFSPDYFTFETPDHTGHFRYSRLMVDLCEALIDDKQRLIVDDEKIKFSRAITALATLKTKVVINLDATPCKALLREVFPNLSFYGDSMATVNTHITQVVGRLLSPQTVKAETLRQIESISNKLLEPYEDPFIAYNLCWFGNDKGENPEMELKFNKEAKRVYWGYGTRSLNAFKDCDFALLIGNYQPPINETRLKINALRQSIPENDGKTEEMAFIQQAGTDNLTYARRQLVDPDPLVRGVIEEIQSSEVIQAIGRLRAINRPEPVQVVILNGAVIKGLCVDKVFHWRDLIPTSDQEHPQDQNLLPL